MVDLAFCKPNLIIGSKQAFAANNLNYIKKTAPFPEQFLKSA
jgi:hypothetical protein